MAPTTYYVKLTLASTTGTVDSPRPYAGYLKAAYIKYTGQTAPSLNIATKGSNAPTQTILAVASANTSGLFQPQMPTHKAADGTALTGWYADPVVDDYLTFAVTAGGAAGSIEFWFTIESF